MPTCRPAIGSHISTPTGDYLKRRKQWQQARLKELEQRKIEAENSEIVEMVRGMSVSLTELPLLLEKLRSGETLGQVVPKSGAVEMEDN